MPNALWGSIPGVLGLSIMLERAGRRDTSPSELPGPLVLDTLKIFLNRGGRSFVATEEIGQQISLTRKHIHCMCVCVYISINQSIIGGIRHTCRGGVKLGKWRGESNESMLNKFGMCSRWVKELNVE